MTTKTTSDERVHELPTLPVMIARSTHMSIVELTRVPCIGEIIHLETDLGTDREGQSLWRVVSVQHLPPTPGHKFDVVAEVTCVEAKDFDQWAGEFPGNPKVRSPGAGKRVGS